MKTLAALAFLGSATFTLAQETAVVPTIESVGLFKNGLCAVHASFDAKAPGVFRWEEPPRSVHGTFFVESDSTVTVQSTLRQVETAGKVEAPTGNLQNDLAGCDVHLIIGGAKGGTPAHINGKVWTMPVPEIEPKQWNTQYAPDPYSGYGWNARQGAQTTAPPVPTTGGFLVLEKNAGTGAPAKDWPALQYISLSQIDQLEILASPALRKQPKEKSVMLFTVEKPGPVRLSWLTKGATWIPSYFVDITDAKSLRVRQTAIIKNELMSLKDTNLDLISGFPNVPFAQVDSPLSQSTSLAGFFQQISSRSGNGAGSALTQNSVAYNNRAGEAIPLPDMKEAGASSEDLHFESLGKRTMAAGDALSLNVAEGTTEYERVVEWTIDDVRDAYGQYSSSSGSRRGGERISDDDQPWDALLFKNPLKFPMTTASATIRDGGRFRGQTQSNWTNPGQRTCMRITKALSVQADHNEIEEPGKREQEIWMGGNRYYRASVKGEATVRNFRATPVTMLARAQFSGELIAAEAEPVDTLRREGVFSVNARHELEWKIVLPAGGEKKLNYSYAVLVRN